MKKCWLIALLLGVLLVATSFGATIKLATTTSTDNSGLLKYLLPIFTKASGVDVDVIAVGTGKAFKIGEAGDADILMVHDPKGEEEFMKAGWGERRYPLMYNDFVVVGPVADPLTLKGLNSAIKAFKLFSSGKAKFISRADDSGTDRKEKGFWKIVGVNPKGDWYVEAGQGMEQTLLMASEMQGYTLADRATYLAMRPKLKLPILVEGDSLLYNPYSVITLNPAKHPGIKSVDAQKLADWLVSPAGLKAIADFKIDGVQVFFPLTNKPKVEIKAFGR